MADNFRLIKTNTPAVPPATPLPAATAVNLRGWRGVWPHLLALAFYLVLILVVAWPVVTNLSSGTPGHFETDRNQNLWNLWWVKRSLLETHTNPYFTDFLFYPYGVNLYLHTLSPYNVGLGLPLQLIFGLIPAFGILELHTFVLAGYGGWLLTRYLLVASPLSLVPSQSKLSAVSYQLSANEIEGRKSKVEGQEQSSIKPTQSSVLSPQSLKSSIVNRQSSIEVAALLGGLVYGFSAYHFYTLSMDQINLTSIQWLPFFVLFVLKADRANTRREIIKNVLLAACFFLLTLLVDYYYATYLLMFAALYWLWQLAPLWWGWLRKKVALMAAWRPSLVLTLKLAAVFGIAFVVFSPVLIPTLVDIRSGNYKPLENTTNSQTRSADLTALFLPPVHQPFWGRNWSFWQDNNILLPPTGALFGWVCLGLAIYALWRVRGLWFWAFQALFWTVIAFGPTLRVNGGETALPMPYRLLAKLPLLNIGRAPERYIVMTQLALAVLAAFALARLLAVRPRRFPQGRVILAGLIGLAFIIEIFPGILPPPDKIRPFPFAQYIAANNGRVPADQAILEIPVTKHSNPDSPRMLYQIFHARPILGGYISRRIVDPHRTANTYALYDFIELRDQDKDIIPPKTTAEWQGLLNYANMGYVVYYPGDFQRGGDQQRAERILASRLDKPIYRDDLAVVYAVPSGKLERPVMVLGQGWYERENAPNQQSQRWINLTEDAGHANIVVAPGVKLAQNYSLQIDVANYFKPRRLQIWLNDKMLREVEVSSQQQIKLDNIQLQPGDNILRLRPNPQDGADSPAATGDDPNDTRRLSILVRSIALN